MITLHTLTLLCTLNTLGYSVLRWHLRHDGKQQQQHASGGFGEWGHNRGDFVLSSQSLKTAVIIKGSSDTETEEEEEVEAEAEKEEGEVQIDAGAKAEAEGGGKRVEKE